jgi:serine/threonine protein kinase
VLDHIASGGIATVYKVLHEELEVVRAIKMLKPGFTEETKNRFKTEAKISANLHHPNIVQTYTVDSWNDAVPYIEMEFVDGFSLHEMLTRKRTLPWLFAAAVARIICRALDYAQQQEFTVYGKVYKGMVHRDIKPANILLSHDGIVKLADFGIALPGNESLHTQGPYTMGTYAYLSPEQLNGEKLDQRSDLYSLGVVMYEMVSGVKAFPQKSVAELVQRKMKGSFTPLKSVAAGCPRAFARVVERCVAADSGKRFQSSHELGCQLDSLIADITSDNPEHIVAEYITEAQDASGAVAGSFRRGAQRARWIKRLLAVGLPVACLAGALYYLLQSGALVVSSPSTVTADLPPTARPAEPIDPAASRTPESATQSPRRLSHNEHRAPAAPPASPARASSTPATRPQRPIARQSIESPYREGMRALDAHDYSQAITHFKKALSGDMSRDSAVLAGMRLLEARLKNGDFDKARAQARSNPLDDAYFHLLAGRLSKQDRELDQALIHFIKARTTSSRIGSTVNREAAFEEALLRNDFYKRKPNLPNLQLALSSWTAFVEQYCTAESHGDQCTEARKQIARLSSR